MITEEIANFIVKTDYQEIPPEAMNNAKMGILDCLGVTLAGSTDDAVSRVNSWISEVGGKPEASVIAHGFKTASHLAALANGTMAHALDFDDVSYTAAAHPTAVLLPAVVALGEKYRCSGKECLAAYIIGFEVMGKVASTVWQRHYELGWHTTSTFGSIGAAAAVSKLLCLNVSQTRMALGIAASLASGLRDNFGSMTKPLHAGNAARNGIVAGLLAQKGITANENILEGPCGFYRVFAGGEWHLPEAGYQWGKPFNSILSGIAFKPYPSCRETHQAIDAALYLRKEYNPDPARITSIECRTSHLAPQILIHHHPETALEAKFSLEYCIAVALLEGEVFLAQFKEESVKQPKVQSLLNKVSYTHPSGWWEGAHAPKEVVIRLDDHKELSCLVEIPRGDHEKPMSWDELSVKYRRCADMVLSPQNSEQVLNMVSSFERVEDITRLMDLLRSGKEGN